MKELVDKLNKATKAYDEGHPIMSDEAWDDLYFELVEKEKETGIVLPDSPTATIPYSVVNELAKVEHNHPMLSLSKTKSLDEVQSFCSLGETIAMCKMDGLTLSLCYRNGKLVKAETRGNGWEGEDVLHNALVIDTIPNRIPYRQLLIIDGEIICKYSDFVSFENDYKNPRGFAAGSIRLLNSKECKKRKLTFVAWDIIDGFSELSTLSEKLDAIKEFGFVTVPYTKDVANAHESLRTEASALAYPIDGVVYKYNVVDFGASLGSTAHHFKNAVAYKFYDECYETQLRDIEWSMGRTGQLTPIAIFDPVEIDSTEVSKASLHNISVMNETLGSKPFVGQKVYVAKMNLIIPQIVDAEKNDDGNPNELPIPQVCPFCGEPTEQVTEFSSTMLCCTNLDCGSRLINRLDHFVGKKGLDIKGLSKATLEKLIDLKWVEKFSDIFKLQEHESEWTRIQGFGKKSVENILSAIDAAKDTSFANFLSAIGIPFIGVTLAKELASQIPSYEDFRAKVDSRFDFTKFNGIATEKAYAILHFDYTEADDVYQYLNLQKSNSEEKKDKLNGLTFVITGRLVHFTNRGKLQQLIEDNSGKVTNSVTSKTSYLINNDISSTSSKNATAKKLGIPIITEDELIVKIKDENF